MMGLTEGNGDENYAVEFEMRQAICRLQRLVYTCNWCIVGFFISTSSTIMVLKIFIHVGNVTVGVRVYLIFYIQVTCGRGTID